MNARNKLETLSKNKHCKLPENLKQYEPLLEFSFMQGFKDSFKIIDENLAKELSKLENYPFMGERIMTLKIYKSKIQEYLKEMELHYE